jgi:uridylate kinase
MIANNMKYKRVLLKLSGEALMGDSAYGIDPARLNQYADEIDRALKTGSQLAIVIGGGNIYRGLQGAEKGMDRVTGDYMGMLATVINSLALQGALKSRSIPSVLLSGLPIERIAEAMSGPLAIELLMKGNVVIIAGGTGNPFFTTDTAAALRAIEIEADIILKGTRVDGVYNTDPEKDSKAIKYENLTYNQAISGQLKVMDQTAFTLCHENKIPMIVFDMNCKGNLDKILKGEKVGTIITS